MSDIYTPALPRSQKHRVLCGEQEVPVVASTAADFVSLSSQEALTLRIITSEAFAHVCVRPARYGIRPVLAEKEIQVNLPGPGYYSVECDRSLVRPLLIFIDDQQRTVPRTARVFEAGVHDVGDLWLQSGDHIHLAAGAVVRGCLRAQNAENICISGPGILDGSQYAGHEREMIQFAHCRNVVCDGFIINESKSWTLVLLNCEDAHIQNVKIINDFGSDDGMDICGSKRVRIHNCFVRSSDDNITIKSVYYPKFHIASGCAAISEDIHISGCTLWVAALANCCEIGFETQADEIRNIIFEDCDILHQESPGSVFSIHNGDRAHIHDIIVRNIRCEDVRGTLFALTVVDDIYRVDTEKGRISNVLIQNVCVVSGRLPASEIEGGSPECPVENVRIENLYLRGAYLKKEGVKARTAFEARLLSHNASNIIITHDGSNPEIADELVTALNPPTECWWR